MATKPITEALSELAERSIASGIELANLYSAKLEEAAALRAENARLEQDLKIATESLRVMDSAADAIILCDACQLCSEHDGLFGE